MTSGLGGVSKALRVTLQSAILGVGACWVAYILPAHSLGWNDSRRTGGLWAKPTNSNASAQIARTAHCSAKLSRLPIEAPAP